MYQYIILAIVGYLLGSILFSLYIPKIIFNTDIIKESKDGNPGTANVMKICGIPTGIVCLILDLAKGFLPIYVSIRYVDIYSLWFILIMISPVLGHAFPIFNKFIGGKSIATSFGVLLGLLPYNYIVLLLAVIYIFLSTIIVIKPNRIRSICTYTFFAVICLFLNNMYSITIGCIIISIIVLFKHVMCRQKSESKVLLLGKFQLKNKS